MQNIIPKQLYYKSSTQLFISSTDHPKMSSQNGSGKTAITKYLREHIIEKKPFYLYEEHAQCERIGVRRNKIEAVARQHNKMKDDWSVCDTVRIIIDKAEVGSYLWSFAGHEGLPAKISSYFFDNRGVTVRNILRQNLLNTHNLRLCSMMLCSPERRLQIDKKNTNLITHNNKMCPSMLKSRAKRAPRCCFTMDVRNVYSGAMETRCYCWYFCNSYFTPKHHASYMLSKLPPSTWTRKIGNITFADHIVATTITTRMDKYARNDELKERRMNNQLLGWGEKEKRKRQQLVGQTFQLLDSNDAATYTITQVLFGGTGNINGFIVRSSLDNTVSFPFKIDVRSHKQGYVIYFKFHRIHPFPRMHRFYEKRFLNYQPIKFDKCPSVVLWACCSVY